MNKKELMRRRTGNGKSAYDCVKEELKVLERLEHPNIIFLHEIIDDPSKTHLYLVTEYHSRGSLGDLVKTANLKFEDKNKERKRQGLKPTTVGLKEKEVRLYMIDMLRALEYCHHTI